MLKIATVRVTEDFLEDLSNFVKEMKLDKSSYLRDILKKGVDEDRQERLLLRYLNGELSVGEVCNMLDKSPCDFFDLLKKKESKSQCGTRRLAGFSRNLVLMRMRIMKYRLSRKVAKNSLSWRL